MKKKVFLLSMVTAGALAMGVAVFSGADNWVSPSISYNALNSGESLPLVLDKNQAPATVTTDYQNNVTGTVKTVLGNDVKLKFVNAKKLDNGFVQLANHGKIYNFDGGNAVTGFNKISFTGEGSLVFKPVLPGGILVDSEPIVVAPGTEYEVPVCDYFEIEAGDSGASITSLSLFYSCDAEEASVGLLDGTYTGIGEDGYTYMLTVSNGEAHIASLDKQSNIALNGTVVMLDKDTAKCTFSLSGATIYYTMDFDGHSFTFVEKSAVPSPAANLVTRVDFDRVYNVDDFESYATTGTGYVSAATKYTTTGMRSQYYADYYTGSGSGEIGGSGWPVMTSTDNSNWRNNKGRDGSAGGIFKFSNGMGMRYISMNSLYGVKSVVGKGSVLSFWARGAYTNANFNVNHANNTTMKFYAYYASPLTPSNQTTVRETFDFTVNAGSEWQHFEMPLTAGRTYYGFGFFAQQKSGSTQYVPIDDIKIYTASPYAEYVAPVAVTGVTVDPSAANITVGGSTQLTATVAPSDATNKNVNWSSNATGVATVDSTGRVTAVAEGSATITATTVDGGFTSTCAVTVSKPSLNYPEGTFKGTAIVNDAGHTIVLAIGNSTNGLVSVKLDNQDAGATAISYNSSTKEISITTTGNYSGFTYGTITGVYDAENDKLINIACAGTISANVSNNGSIEATRLDYLWGCDDSTAELQSIFKRRYGDPWTVDTKNSDRITRDTTHYVSGTGALKLRSWNGGRYALNFNSDFSTAITVANVHFWVYNPSGSNVTLRMWGYRAVSFGSNFETGSVTAKANGWTYCSMGFTSGGIYNFQIADFTNTGAALTFDNIALF